MRIFIYECLSAGGLGPNAAESLRREGRAMLDAVVADFQRVPNADVVTIGDEAAFANAAASCDWSLVIAPEFDGLLESRAQAVLDAGGRLLGSSPSAIRLTANKLATAIHWQKRAVVAPPTQVLDPFQFASFPCPWVLKPRHGAGSMATFLIRRRADAAEAMQQARAECPHSAWIVQQYVPGQAASVALLIGKAQTIALAPARQHLSEDGRFRYVGGSLPLPAPLAERATRLAVQAVAGIDGLHGYVGVDLVLGDDGIDYAIEINPRLTTSYIGLRQLCKENLAQLMLRLALGETVAPPQWHTHPVRFAIDPGEKNP